jgi:hypothetical protein
MSYAANLKNVMNMQNRQKKEGEEQTVLAEEAESSKPGPSAHDLAAQLKSSLLAEIGLTESEGPPLTSFRYLLSESCVLFLTLLYGYYTAFKTLFRAGCL